MDTHAPPPPPAPTTRAAPRRHRVRYVLLVTVPLALVALYVGLPHKPRPPTRGAGHSEPQSVSVAIVGRADIAVTLEEIGTVTPITTVTVKSQLSGYLTEVAFHEGQDVKKGDFLAEVDPRPYQAVLTQYQGNLLRDQAQLKLAEVNLERYRRLAKLDSTAELNVDQAEATVAQYQGAIETDQGQIDAEKLDLIYAHITAPADGRLGLRLVDIGNYVTPGDAQGLVVITEIHPISVIFTIPQTELAAVLEALHQGTLGVTALDTDGVTPLATGSVETIDNQIDTTTGTVKLRAIFANGDGRLFPNQFVNIALHTRTIGNAITVPDDAVQHGAPGTYVFLVRGGSSVTLRKITTGPSAGGLTAVTAGLVPGDQVVMQGISRLHDGAKIRVVPAS